MRFFAGSKLGGLLLGLMGLSSSSSVALQGLVSHPFLLARYPRAVYRHCNLRCHSIKKVYCEGNDCMLLSH